MGAWDSDRRQSAPSGMRDQVGATWNGAVPSTAERPAGRWGPPRVGGGGRSGSDAREPARRSHSSLSVGFGWRRRAREGTSGLREGSDSNPSATAWGCQPESEVLVSLRYPARGGIRGKHRGSGVHGLRVRRRIRIELYRGLLPSGTLPQGGLKWARRWLQRGRDSPPW